MAKSELTEFRVTFREMIENDLVRETCETGFMGLCERTKVTSDPRILMLWASADEYRALKAQLEEMRQEGALTFSEQPASLS